MSVVETHRTAVLVAGMHRSGTSALTRVLAGLGCDLPATLMEANEYNVAGYWESQEIVDLNDALLASAGSSWDDWEPFHPGWYASPVAGDWRRRATAAVGSEFGQSTLFVLKDPRVCRLLPFWFDVLEGLGVDCRVVLPIRSPLEVARSLEDRDAMEPSVGMLLWLRHVLDAEAASRNRPRSFVRFDGLLDNWESLADSMGRELKICWPRRSTPASLEIEERLDPTIRHHVLDTALGARNPEIPPWVGWTFDVLDRWSHGVVNEDDRGGLDAVRTAFDEAGATFARAVVAGVRVGRRNRALTEQADVLEGEASTLRELVSDRDGRIEALQREVANRNENASYLNDLVAGKDAQVSALQAGVEALDRKIEARDRKIESRDQKIESRDQKIDALNQEVAGRDGEIASLRGRINELDTQLDAMGQTVGNRDGEVASLRGRVNELDAQLDAMGQTVGNRDAEVASLRGRINELDAQLDAMGQTVGDRDAEVASLRGRINELGAQLDVVDQTVGDRDAELSAVYASTSWRLTRPLREGKRAVKGGVGLIARGALAVASPVLGGVGKVTWLPRSWRTRLQGAALSTAARRLVSPPTVFIHSGWLDLADRNYYARALGGPLPILFDPDFYLGTYPDIAASGRDPLTHYVQHGAVEGRWPIRLDGAEIDPTIEALHRFDTASEDAHTFDLDFTRTLYPELASLEDGELALVCAGEGGSRVGSMAAFLRELCDNPREIPIDFNAAAYLALYPDLRALADRSPLEALRHYMVHGRFEPRLHTLRVEPVRRREATPDLPPQSCDRLTPPLCVLAHVYYPDLWDEIADCLLNLPSGSFDLYVNLVDDTFDGAFLAKVRGLFPEARVYISENIGRDIGGYLALWRNLPAQAYDVFCLVHTKKSPHIAPGAAQQWRRQLLRSLLGDPERAAENLQKMLDDQTIGQLGSGRFRNDDLAKNREKYGRFLNILNIDEAPEALEFLSGTMMFVRGAVLRRVFEAASDLPLEAGDPRTAGGDPDGTWAHAVERAFGAVVRDMGYRFEWR